MARDAVQETLLAALRSADKFEGRSSLRTWLVAILQHKMSDLLRVRAREAPLYENCAVEEQDNGDPDWDCGGDDSRPTETALQGNDKPEAESERNEFFSTFEGCLGRIPRRSAEAFVSSVLGEPLAEIARRMGVTANHCSQILFRARKRLGACFTDCWFKNEKRVPALKARKARQYTLEEIFK
ncbi:MAG: sigma-70 family RNA polymerase sigma factor [Betaproteobacteria bacterium]|nr:sigma-70 family RNA polymerase sigma factor [Betaproteobacteria bacterium]MBI2961869.1 sigma-70 family RNA polymerase sigma factor [Betaproteobacteria bacterium]